MNSGIEVGYPWRIETIEDRHLYHVHPGTQVVALELSQFEPRLKCSLSALTPLAITEKVTGQGGENLALSDLELSVLEDSFADIADACSNSKVGLVISTAGTMPLVCRNADFESVKAVNLHLKGFTDSFYVQQTGSQLRPVLETLLYIYHETGCWLEITTCLMPGLNDHPVEIDAMTKWLVKYLGHDVPLHLTFPKGAVPAGACHSPVPPTMRRAQKIAQGNGLSHVYLDQLEGLEACSTLCDCCGRTLIVRQAGEFLRSDLVNWNSCPSCGMKLQGRFAQSLRSPISIGPLVGENLFNISHSDGHQKVR